MMLISHRGNINGRNIDRENTVSYIQEALSEGYHVEVDIWLVGKKWYLGHDAPMVQVNEEFLLERNQTPSLWLHCKNIEALSRLTWYRDYKGFPNFFTHDTDPYTITSNGFIWVYPGKPLCERSICVLPERASYSTEELTVCCGICSDFIIRYKK
jgi:hypothetical protein